MVISEIEETVRKKWLVYKVCFNNDDEKDNKMIKKIKEFADKSAGNTYKRSQMKDDEHKRNIITGKMAEYAFSKLIHHYTGILIQPSFENRVDLFDFNISGLKIDIKSSSMTTKRKRYSLSEALSSFNFTVLLDQSFKDVIVQALYPSREKHSCFYFSVWQYVKNVLNAKKIAKIKMNGGYGKYYLLPLTEGKPLSMLFEKVRGGKNA